MAKGAICCFVIASVAFAATGPGAPLGVILRAHKSILVLTCPGKKYQKTGVRRKYGKKIHGHRKSTTSISGYL